MKCDMKCDEARRLMHQADSNTALPEEVRVGHLPECPECAEEWALIRGVRGVRPQEMAVDVQAVARRVLLRLANARPDTARPTRRRMSRIVIWATAAAVAFGVGLSSLRSTSAPILPISTVSVLPELADLRQDELNQLLAILPAVDPLSQPLGAGLSDMTDDELQRLLRAMEG